LAKATHAHRTDKSSLFREKMTEDDLPFGERTAQRLMAIARKRLTNPTCRYSY
jgi:hypothetical protein